MDPERFARLKRLYGEACHLDPSQRAAFLESACGDDEELRQRLLALLEDPSHPILRGPLRPGSLRPGGMGVVPRA